MSSIKFGIPRMGFRRFVTLQFKRVLWTQRADEHRADTANTTDQLVIHCATVERAHPILRPEPTASVADQTCRRAGQ